MASPTSRVVRLAAVASLCLLSCGVHAGGLPEADWEALGDGLPVFGGDAITSVVSWDSDGDGPIPARLVVAGDIALPGGSAGSRVVQWDGAQWTPLGLPFNSTIETLCVYDPDGDGPELARLVVGGRFTLHGASQVGYIAEWTGTTWVQFGVRPSDNVWAMTTWDPDGDGPQPVNLVAVGNFAQVGNTIVRGIARWDGSQWHPFGSGFGSQMGGLAVATWDPDGPGPANEQVIAGGNFGSVGGQTVRFIARWDGQQWFPLGSGVSAFVEVLCTWDPDGPGPQSSVVVAGGNFFSAGGVAVNRVAAWDGNQWSALGGGIKGDVRALGVWDDDGDASTPDLLIASGGFLAAGDTIAPAVASWNGEEWSRFGLGLIRTPPSLPTSTGFGRALAQFDADGDGPLLPVMVVGGEFDSAGCDDALNVAALTRNPRCVGDVNRDGTVDFADLNDLLSSFGFVSIAPGVICSDFNDDGFVDFADLNAVLSRFGEVCE